MFTDIVGYTAMMGKDEEAALQTLEVNRQLHTDAIQAFHGTLLKELGDGIMAVFSAASDAVLCAKKIQETHRKDSNILLRIGIHLGEVVFEESDVFGDGVNIASRIEQLSPAGGIYISESVLRNVENKKEIETVFVGEKLLKNVKHPVKLYAVKIDSQSIHPVSDRMEDSDENMEKSIAILPFVNMSNDPDQDYFCDGLCEELLNSLAQLDKFKVASRTSSFMFKGKSVDIFEVGQTLRVDNVLEGSVRRSKNRIRITVQLISVRDGYHLWSERYDRELADIFDIQDEIALAIVDSLRLKLLGSEKKTMLKRGTENPEAYQLYLRGRQHFHRFTPDDFLKAIGFYKAAIAVDPTYAKAFAGVASCYLNLWHFDMMPPELSRPQMIEATQKAVEFDDQIARSETRELALDVGFRRG
jgi:TolB-like protein